MKSPNICSTKFSINREMYIQRLCLIFIIYIVYSKCTLYVVLYFPHFKFDAECWITISIVWKINYHRFPFHVITTLTSDAVSMNAHPLDSECSVQLSKIHLSGKWYIRFVFEMEEKKNYWNQHIEIIHRCN